MIPLAELPTTDGVYVIHFSAPLAPARGYVGWSIDIARRVAEHLDVQRCADAGFHVASHRSSPLVCASVRAGRTVQVGQIYPGGDRGLERRLHNRLHPRVCVECRGQRPPRPRQLPLFRRQPAPPRRGAGAAPLWRLRHAA